MGNAEMGKVNATNVIRAGQESYAILRRILLTSTVKKKTQRADFSIKSKENQMDPEWKETEVKAITSMTTKTDLKRRHSRSQWLTLCLITKKYNRVRCSIQRRREIK